MKIHWELITNPTLMDKAVSPNLKLYLFFGLLVGLIMGSIIASNKEKNQERFMKRHINFLFQMPKIN